MGSEVLDECRRLVEWMLSIGKLAAVPGAGQYYVRAVAHGREDYYAGEGEAAPGANLTRMSAMSQPAV